MPADEQQNAPHRLALETRFRCGKRSQGKPMKKISSLFKRDYKGNRLVYDEVVPGSEWVIAGEGVATRKFDGTCCMVQDGKLFKRYDCSKGRKPPIGFIPTQDPDPETGHWPGWVLVGEGPDDRWHREAFLGTESNGTYELCGPNVQGNPECFTKHVLVPHGHETLPDAPRTFYAIRAYLETKGIEGIVWHHPDGRMVKIKRKDFFTGSR